MDPQTEAVAGWRQQPPTAFAALFYRTFGARREMSGENKLV